MHAMRVKSVGNRVWVMASTEGYIEAIILQWWVGYGLWLLAPNLTFLKIDGEGDDTD